MMLTDCSWRLGCCHGVCTVLIGFGVIISSHPPPLAMKALRRRLGYLDRWWRHFGYMLNSLAEWWEVTCGTDRDSGWRWSDTTTWWRVMKNSWLEMVSSNWEATNWWWDRRKKWWYSECDVYPMVVPVRCDFFTDFLKGVVKPVCWLFSGVFDKRG